MLKHCNLTKAASRIASALRASESKPAIVDSDLCYVLCHRTMTSGVYVAAVTRENSAVYVFAPGVGAACSAFRYSCFSCSSKVDLCAAVELGALLRAGVVNIGVLPGQEEGDHGYALFYMRGMVIEVENAPLPPGMTLFPLGIGDVHDAPDCPSDANLRIARILAKHSMHERCGHEERIVRQDGVYILSHSGHIVRSLNQRVFQ